jgi:2-dehydro-3-deoxygluconokinase
MPKYGGWFFREAPTRKKARENGALEEECYEVGRMKIGVLGALNIDFVIHGSAPTNPREVRNWVGPSQVSFLTAGSVGYFSQNFSKLGCEIHLVSTIADDTFGKSILSSLKKAGISTKHLTVEPGTESGIGIYMLLFGAKKRPMTYRLPTHHAWPSHLLSEQINYLLDTEMIHCGGYLHFSDLWNEDVPSLFASAKKRGSITSLDPQFPLIELEPPWAKVLKPIIANTDVLFVDKSEALGVSGATTLKEATEILGQIGADKVVIKLGDKGCLVLCDGMKLHQPAVKPTKFVDSIGAGDSFDVGFLYGMSKGYTPEKAAKIAVYSASRSIEGIGGTTAFPSMRELKTIEEEN